MTQSLNMWSRLTLRGVVCAVGLAGAAGHAQPAYWWPSIEFIDQGALARYATASWGGHLYSWRSDGVGNFTLHRRVGETWEPAWTGVNPLSVPRLNGPPSVMVVHGADLYVGGEFDLAGVPGGSTWTTQVNGLVRIKPDGGVWEGLPAAEGSSIEFGVLPAKVFALLSHGNTLYIGGEFTQIGTLTMPVIRSARSVAKFTTGVALPYLEAVGAGVDYQVRDFAWLNGRLYAAGATSIPLGLAPCTPAPFAGVTRFNFGGVGGGCWEGVEGVWNNQGGGVFTAAEAKALAVHEGKLYVGGNFTHVGPAGGPMIAAANIAVLAGDNGPSPAWQALTAGGLHTPFDPSAHVEDLISMDIGCGPEMFAIGDFVRTTTMPALPLINIASLRGEVWRPLDTDCPSPGPMHHGCQTSDLKQIFVKHGTRLYAHATVVNSSTSLLANWGVCFGDANGDLVVDFLDLNIVLGEYEFSTPVQGDLNCDGTVDFLDLNIVLSYFGAVCDSICNP